MKDLLWGLKMLGSLAGASSFMALQVVLFFTLQEAWKARAEGNIQQEGLVILTVSFILLHIPILGAVLWFTRAVQHLWDDFGKRDGG